MLALLIDGFYFCILNLQAGLIGSSTNKPLWLEEHCFYQQAQVRNPLKSNRSQGNRYSYRFLDVRTILKQAQDGQLHFNR